MESLDPAAAACFMDDLLDFASDIGEEDDEDDLNTKPRKAVLPSLTSNGLCSAPFDSTHPLPEFDEEELEWLSDKNAFPTLETFVDILSENPGSLPKQRSPVSVLENSTTSSTCNSGNSGSNGSIIMDYCRSLQVPVKARSKDHIRRPREIQAQQCWWSQENMRKVKPSVTSSSIGRKCQHCGSEKTPQWRAGPLGPKTLCNACGVRYKSGRLVPEYRPASSPSFSSELHSNSHRKVLEMRKQKQMMGFMVAKPMEKG
ncbi:GATA transcription factor 1 [Euphorbia lathyris]|uniref:GATA transcription factor 1 n=1 Tax=Euphorbia lathyris TaxID=212925 RepID=UPI003313B844